MGLTNTTTNLSYARNELIKVGASFIFDKVGDMIYYMLANDDISTTTTTQTTYNDGVNVRFGTDADVYMGVRSAADGTDRWVRSFIDTDAQDTHGLPIGITDGSDDLYGARLSFKWGTGAAGGTYAKRTLGILARLEIDQDLSSSGDVRCFQSEVLTAAKDIGGELCSGYFDTEVTGPCTVGEGVTDTTETYPVMIGIDVRLKTQTGAVKLINTTNSEGYAACIHMYPYLRTDLDGNLSGIHIASPYEESTSNVQGTSYGILFIDDDTDVQDWDYGLYISSGTCTVAMHIASTAKIEFYDSGLYIQASANGKLKLSSDGDGADDITLSGTVTADADLTMSAADINLGGRITFSEDANRTGEGTYLFANGLSIGMATPGDCQGIKMEFDYGATPSLTTGKMVHGLDIKMVMDQAWSVGTKPYNCTVRGGRIQAESVDNVSGRLTGAYISARAFGDGKAIQGYISGLTGPGIIGIQARTEICTSTSIPSTTITTPAAVGVMIYHHSKANAVLTGGYRGLQIEVPLLLSGASISSTTYAMYVGNDWGGADTFDYGLYVKSGTSTIAIQTGASGSDGGDVNFYGAASGELMKWDSSAGTLDITSPMTAADNVVDITVTDATSLAAGRGRALYLKYTVSGTKTVAYAVRTMAIDTFISDACPGVTGLDMYWGNVDDKAISNYIPVSMYIEDIGSGVGNFMALDIGRVVENTGSARDTFIRFKTHSNTTRVKSILEMEGANAKFAGQFILFTGTGNTSSDWLQGGVNVASGYTCDSALRVGYEAVVGAGVTTQYYIPLYTLDV